MTVVVVATNGSPACRRAVARTPALFDGATILVATVVTGGAGEQRPSPPGLRAITDDLAVQAGESILAEACEELGEAAHPVLLTGDPVEALVDTARAAGAGALVVGSFGGGAIARVLGPSVGTSLTREAPCPVVALG